jgi:hypothetical protein
MQSIRKQKSSSRSEQHGGCPDLPRREAFSLHNRPIRIGPNGWKSPLSAKGRALLLAGSCPASRMVNESCRQSAKRSPFWDRCLSASLQSQSLQAGGCYFAARIGPT